MTAITPIPQNLLENARKIDDKKKFYPKLNLLAHQIKDYNDSLTKTNANFVAKKTFARAAAALLIPGNFLLGNLSLGVFSLTAGATATAVLTSVFALLLLLPTVAGTGFLIHYLYTYPVSLESYKEKHRLKLFSFLNNRLNRVDNTLSDTHKALNKLLRPECLNQPIIPYSRDDIILTHCNYIYNLQGELRAFFQTNQPSIQPR